LIARRDSRICLCYLGDDITLFNTLYPILRSREFRGQFEFTDSVDYALQRSRAKKLLLVRFYKRRDIADVDETYLRFKERFEKVFYFDDTASADEIQTTAIKHVDRYFKKQVHCDRTYYGYPSYGKRSFTNYYHRTFGINDVGNVEIRRALDHSEIGKIVPTWNLGIGVYPKKPHRNGLGARLDHVFGAPSVRLLYSDPCKYRPSDIRRKNLVSAHFGSAFDRNTVSYHRKIFLESMATAPSVFSVGRIPLAAYNQELRLAEATLSPFGWGEICFRDFEAIINRSVLIKPAMDHIETWPDIYRPGETYFPVAWDGHDLLETAQSILDNPSESRRVADAAYGVFIDSHRELDARVHTFITALEQDP